MSPVRVSRRLMLTCLGMSHALVVSGGFHQEAGGAFLSDWSNSKEILLTPWRLLVALFHICFAPKGVKVAEI